MYCTVHYVYYDEPLHRRLRQGHLKGKTRWTSETHCSRVPFTSQYSFKSIASIHRPMVIEPMMMYSVSVTVVYSTSSLVRSYTFYVFFCKVSSHSLVTTYRLRYSVRFLQQWLDRKFFRWRTLLYVHYSTICVTYSTVWVRSDVRTVL